MSAPENWAYALKSAKDAQTDQKNERNSEVVS